jgi:hypothetical protein
VTALNFGLLIPDPLSPLPHQAGGLSPALVQRLLRESNPTPLVVDVLLICSQLARASPREQAGGGQGGLAATYEALAQSNLLPVLRRLLSHHDSGEQERAGVQQVSNHQAQVLIGCCWSSLLCSGSKLHQTAPNKPTHAAPFIAVLVACACAATAGVRARVANLLGNMCRHSGYFYPALERHGILPPLIERCSDTDKGARWVLGICNGLVLGSFFA